MTFATLLHDATGYINSGGRGTRLAHIFKTDPELGISKALLQVGEPPLTLIEHQINKLTSAGFSNVVAGVGDHVHVGSVIKDAYKSLPDISAVGVETQLGNGGDLVRAVREHPDLFRKTVVITNVDTVLDWDEAAALSLHRTRNAGLTIVLTLSKNVPNEGAFYIGRNDQVLYCGEATVNLMTPAEAAFSSTYRGSSTGALIIETEWLRSIIWQPEDGALSLYKDIMALALEQGIAFAYNNGERFFIDVGTVPSWNYISKQPGVLQPYLYYENERTTEGRLDAAVVARANTRVSV